MKSFPFGLLTLVLLALDLVFNTLWLLRKRLARQLCKRWLAKGKRDDVVLFIMQARSQSLIKPIEANAWLEEFGLEDV
jgi:hypothetical protein